MDKHWDAYCGLSLVHFLAFPDYHAGDSSILETVERVVSDDFFSAIEISRINNPGVRRDVARLIEQTHIKVDFGAHPIILGDKLNLNSLDSNERNRARKALEPYIDQATELGAGRFVLLSGPDPGVAKRNDAHKALVASLQCLGEYAKSRHISLVLETLLLACYETTMSFIGNATLALLRNPMQLEKLESKTDSSVFATAIEELLRYDGPIHRQWRVATEDTEFEGKQIGKGQLVAAMLGAANRDPAQFPDPDRLDVTRHNVRHVGFGYGIHFCLGASLARLEGEVAIKTLIHRFPRMRLADEIPKRIQEITIHGLRSLPVVVD